jgi:hypothetical protein
MQCHDWLSPGLAEGTLDPVDPEDEHWCAEQRLNVIRYLQDQGLTHGPVGEVPAWFLSPYVAIWAVESLKAPGWVGWWVISGDLPTDYCSAEECRHPRLAMKRIAEQWRSQAERTTSADLDIGDTGLDAMLLPELGKRADALLEMVADDEIWPE